jgi:disulfide bond formation protein DsbB
MRHLVMGLAVSLAVAVAACGGTGGGETTTTGVPGAGDPVRGLALFNGTCIACHGPGGIGAAGLGKPLTTSSFAAGLTDAELLAFLDIGRPADDPLNTTGIAMPARGGNPALSDADLMDVVAFVRTING